MRARVQQLSLALLFALPTILPAQTNNSPFAVHGILSAVDISATGPKTWMEGGWGRVDGPGAFATAQLGVDWTPASWLDVHVSGLARHEPSDYQGKSAGLTEAFADIQGNALGGQMRLRAGLFFLGTSRENIDDLWTSPYTISLSALNSWIAQEVRPTGVELSWRNDPVTFAATAFRGNDTAGTLVAWHGWTIGNRVSVYNEVIPLPPIPSLSDPTMFGGRQRPDGSKPFGHDLDGRTGFALRARVAEHDRYSVQLTHYDNRGDRKLYDGEYAWTTRFDVLGVDFGSPEGTALLGEYARGNTGMGIFEHAFVQASFRAGYVMLSHKQGKIRTSLRLDSFGLGELDHSAAEIEAEHGHAYTGGVYYEPNVNTRAGVEYTKFEARRPDVPNPDAHAWTAEVRYRF